MEEKILCAAIYIDDGLKHGGMPNNVKSGYVICGRRHHNCYQVLEILKGPVNEIKEIKGMSTDQHRKHQGFLTSLDRYVDRREAYQIALKQNQIAFGLEANDPDSPILISEHLY